MRTIKTVNKIESAIFSGQEPTLIMGGVRDWKAMEKWNTEYLRNNLPLDNKASFFSFSNSLRRMRHPDIKLGDALTQLQTSTKNGEECFYLPRQELSSNLIRDIEIPDRIMRMRYSRSNLWFGQNLSITPLHYDSASSYICQIAGYKKIHLVPPSNSMYLYPHSPLTSGRHNFSQINHFHDISVREYPAFLFSETYSILLSPGDSIYIPRGWWHQVYNLGLNSIAVNIFFDDKLHGHTPKQEILIYQACKTGKGSIDDQLINRSHYFQCLKTARELLESGNKRYACLFAAAYFEEYLKAHLLRHYFSVYLSSEKNDKIRIILQSLFDTSNTNQTEYFENIRLANQILGNINHTAYIPDELLSGWLKISENVLTNEFCSYDEAQIKSWIEQIEKICTNEIYKPESEFDLRFDY